MILLDTHVWLRWLAGEEDPLPKSMQEFIRRGGQLAVSAVSIWEAAYLAQAGRIGLGMPWNEWIVISTTGARVEVIPISGSIAARAAHLPLHHR